ncbi:Major facilitator superfamily domain general substrate transporter [Penicillium cinerascens]|uniref:Autophagy-related protein n=1 Tax=Penicillium cinerascens TaxID=70096 RepID=A0A9W9TCR6_9EURO|nr:Major facilitator superfamily domain general substrate transporter [Penicillium cinerascens]KAJ5217968.1 Major facilitator superfamily domain general substrate transporter [Penicillium cinerascens]
MLSSVLAALRSPSFEVEGAPQRPSRYAGEDTTPTSRREILGWYSYGIAAEVFAVCGVGSFLPLTLEQLAREHGTIPNTNQPCWGPGAPDKQNGGDQCVVRFFGLQINTASFAMYTFSLAVLIQALTLISFSALADYGNNRKTLLLFFGFIGSATSMLFVFVAPPVFILGSILAIIGITCLGSSFVVLNSFLPVLVANDASIQSPQSQGGEELSNLHRNDEASDWNTWDEEDSVDGIPNPDHQTGSPEDGLKGKESGGGAPELQRSTQISSKGVGLGYCAAVLVQILSFGHSSNTVCSAVGRNLVVCLHLCLAPMVTLSARSPLDTSSTPGLPKWRAWLRLVGFAWKSLWRTVKVAVQLREVLIFLVAWFLLSDAMATVSGTAILFARTELGLSTIAVGALSITATLSGMAGAFLWPHVSRRFNLQSNQTIIVCIVLFEIIPLYGMLAYIPFIKNWGVLGLQKPWEIFPLAIVHGIVSGGLSSYCRSFFGQLIPPGSEAAFYALYAATDKGSSFIGPAIVGVLIDATGQVRSGFFFIAVLIVLPIPLVWMVNAEKGRREGLAMAERLDKSQKGPTEDVQEAEGLLARET